MAKKCADLLIKGGLVVTGEGIFHKDILVVDGDPLKDITVLGDKTKLSHIFLNGKEIKREEEIKDITPPQGWRLSPYSDGILTQELAKK